MRSGRNVFRASTNASERQFQRALDAFAGVVGKWWVLATEEDRAAYMEAYAPGDAEAHLPGAAVGLQSAEGVQAIVPLANVHVPSRVKP